MSELKAILEAQKRKAGGGGAGSDSVAQACDNYRVDLTGSSFGVCVCGFKKADHVKDTGHRVTRTVKPPVVSSRPVARAAVAPPPRKTTPKPATTRPSPTPKAAPVPTPPVVEDVDNSKKVFKALYGFSSTRTGDLTLEEGDIVEEVVKNDNGWWKGTITRNGVSESGMFPSDFVEATTISKTQEPAVVTPPSSSNFAQLREKVAQNTPKVPGPSKTASPEAKPAPSPPKRQSAKPAPVVPTPAPPPPIVSQPVVNEPVHAAPPPAEAKKSVIPKISVPKMGSVKSLQEKLKLPIGAKPTTVDEPAARKFKALFDFQTGEDGDLPFDKGDVLTLVKELDDNWFECVDASGSKGIVPKDYLEEIEATVFEKEVKQPPPPPPAVAAIPQDVSSKAPPPPPPVASEPMKIATALFDFDAQQPEDITFRKGDSIKVTQEIDSNWWKGVVLDSNGQETSQSGVFPLTFVAVQTAPPPPVNPSYKPVEVSPIQQQPNTGAPPPPPRKEPVAQDKRRAMYDFDAEEEGDLGLKKGQIVIVTEVTGDWLQGYIEGTEKKGQFPAAYVGEL